MKELLKLVMIFMLTLPFVALYHDARRGSRYLVPTLFAVTLLSGLICFFFGGFHQRPRVSNLFALAFLAWPVVLLFALKAAKPISWMAAWLSVPLMSWYTVNVSMQFWYPTNAGGGGMGFGLALVAGWLYMIPLFAVASGAVILVSWILDRFKSPDTQLKNE